MPKVTRKEISIFESPVLRFIGILVVLGAIVMGGSIFLGMKDKGAIDVNGKIASTNQDGFANKVNQNSNTNDVNGGLKPASLSPGAPKAPESAPVPEPSPAVAATSTATTSLQTSTTTQKTK